MKRALKVCHLSTVHPVDDARIFHKQCKGLQRAGFEVSLIIRADRDEIIENVNVIAVKSYSHRFLRMLFGGFFVLKKALALKAEVYHFHDPELIPVGIILRLTGKKVIYDVHEDLPKQILSKPWIARPIRKIIAFFAHYIEYSCACFGFSAIVAATPSIAINFPETKTHVIQNFPILDELQTLNSPYNLRSLSVLYLGGITKIRGVIENIQAFDYVNKSAVRFKLAGSFDTPELEQEAKQLAAWHRVDFPGWLNRQQIRALLADSRVGLVLLHPVPNYLEAYPVKLFEYMCAGLPVIVSDFPLWRQIVEDAQCGLLVDPLKPKEIAKAIDWLIDHPLEAEQMGENGRNAVLKKYNWAHEEAKLLSLYQRLEADIKLKYARKV